MSEQSLTPANGTERGIALAKPATILAHYLNDNRDKIERSLNGALPIAKFMQVSMNAIRGSEKLEQSSPPSVLSALLQAAELRLFPGSNLGHAYLVPYWSGKEQVNVCTYILGYKGMIALCHRSSKVLKVEAQTVHEGDEFEIAYGEGGGLKHKPDPWGARTVKNCLGAYAIAYLANETVIFERMSKLELDGIRARSKSGKTGPWATDTLEMYRKTPVRRLAKYLPLEPDDAMAIAEDEARDLGYDGPRDVEAEPVEDPAAALNAQLEAAQQTPPVTVTEPERVEVIEGSEIDAAEQARRMAEWNEEVEA